MSNIPRPQSAVGAILPAVDRLSEPYWKASAKGHLALQRCCECGDVWHPPMPACPQCHSMAIEWQSVSAAGVVYSYTDVHHAVHEAVSELLPYRILLVDLDAGPRVVAGAAGRCATDADIVGARVSAEFEPIEENVSLLIFRLVGETLST